MAEITEQIANLNPFKSKHRVPEEDQGEQIHGAKGQHPFHHPDEAKARLPVSHALKSFIVENKILSKHEVGLDKTETTDALRALLCKPHFHVPATDIDRSYPLPEYFISSSHNTYLLAHQLYGESSASAYEVALRTGSRCVEIDAWDNTENKDEPKVTHGYTLVSHIPFRAVCETIRDIFDEEVHVSTQAPGFSPAPILISLENHCDGYGQLRLVQIMNEVFAHRLLSKPIRPEGQGNHVSLQELGATIAIIVEFHLDDEAKSSDAESIHSSEGEDEKQAREEYKKKKKEQEQEESSGVIVPELAQLGVYAQSVKPNNNSWYDPGELQNGPHHHLINVSETGLMSHLPAHSTAIAVHNSRHLMRVFPKGTRISSSNLKPVPFWGLGSQICALNWQTFGTSNQLNHALFAGTDGFVLKPAALRAGGSGVLNTGRKKRLRLHVAGATNIPVHDRSENDTFKPYLTCNLYHPDDLANQPPKEKTKPYKHHTLGFLHHGENPPATDPIWDETLQWEYEENELVFLRLLIKSDDAWAANPIFATLAVRLSYVTPGWNFLRMLDLKGQDTDCSVLAKFEFEDIQ